MEKVIINAHTINKLDELVIILYENEYFGFYEDAQNYVGLIIKFIYTIVKQRRRKTLNSQNGIYYSQYSPNKNTTYYISFDMEYDVY